MYRALPRIVVMSILWVLSSPTAAVDFYDVEVLIFRQIDNQDDNEILDLPTTRHLDLNLQIESLLGKGSKVELEPAIEGYLAESRQRLDSSPNYEILYHGRWSQTTTNRKSAPFIEIHLPSIRSSHRLDGVVHLFSTDLLYLDTMLRFQPALKDSAHQTSEMIQRPASPYYFLQERRRVKFREIHFLDHPKFGMLFGVWPINLPELVVSTDDEVLLNAEPVSAKPKPTDPNGD